MNGVLGLTSYISLDFISISRVELGVWRPWLFIDVLLEIRYRFVLRFNEQMTWKNIRKWWSLESNYENKVGSECDCSLDDNNLIRSEFHS